jgi:hypothetical protein
VRNGVDEGTAAAQRRAPDRLSGSSHVSSAEEASLVEQCTAPVERHRAARAEVYGLRDDAHRIFKGKQPKLMANVAYALEREELSTEFRRELEILLRQK